MKVRDGNGENHDNLYQKPTKIGFGVLFFIILFKKT